jgi:Snare region anchored in the vesicle membrane C-terminus
MSKNHNSNRTSIVTFERYDTEFQEILQQIEHSLLQNEDTKRNGTTSNNNTSSSSIDYTNNLIQQGHDLLKQMSVEARSVISSSSNDGGDGSSPSKDALLNKVRTFKSQLTLLQSRVTTQSLFSNNNNNNHNSQLNSQKQQQQQALQHNEHMLQQQNETLERAKRSILETEQIALEINDELVQNRETLLSSQNRIRSVSSMTTHAKKVLSSMSQRNIQQKMILYGITIGLIVAFFFLLYTMWG